MNKIIIPMFPLNTVLFPGMWLPLRVFEERYKALVRDCRQADSPFGIALIRRGPEVGGPAEPYPVGTLARIHEVTPLEGGQMFLHTQGTDRFRLLRLIHGTRPYLMAEVEILLEDRAKPDQTAAAETLELYEKYLSLMRSLGEQIADFALDSADMTFLSWLIAATLMIRPMERQELLQIETTEARLSREIILLREHIRVLESRKPARSLPFSMN